jgi:hypothetical protein
VQHETQLKPSSKSKQTACDATPAQPPGRAGLKASQDNGPGWLRIRASNTPSSLGLALGFTGAGAPQVTRRCVWNQVARLAGPSSMPRDQLACYQYLHAGGLDVVDMHKNIGAAVIGRDKAICAIRRRVLQEQLRSAGSAESRCHCAPLRTSVVVHLDAPAEKRSSQPGSKHFLPARR